MTPVIRRYVMNLIDRLYGEHDEHEKNMNILLAVIDEGGELEKLKSAFEEFSKELECHLKEEEEALFPELIERLGPQAMPVYVMLQEHEMMRELISRTKELHSKGERGEEYIKQLIEIVRQHIMKENNILFQMARQVIEPDMLEVQDEIAQKVRKDFGFE